MSAFLFYPEIRFSGKSNNREITAWFPTVDKRMGYCLSDYNEDEVVHFAFIDDTNMDNKDLHCILSFTGGETVKVLGSERITEAKELIKQKFAEYCDVHYPSGLHWVDDSFYLGNMRLAYFFKAGQTADNEGVYVVAIDDMHRNKFFAENVTNPKAAELLSGSIKFKEAAFERVKADLINMVDLARWEKERAEKAAAKMAEKKAVAEFLGLPELSGTEKQIKWAIDIRQKFVNSIKVDVLASKKWKKTAAKAKFWIDNRGMTNQQLEQLAFLK